MVNNFNMEMFGCNMIAGKFVCIMSLAERFKRTSKYGGGSMEECVV